MHKKFEIGVETQTHGCVNAPLPNTLCLFTVLLNILIILFVANKMFQNHRDRNELEICGVAYTIPGFVHVLFFSFIIRRPVKLRLKVSHKLIQVVVPMLTKIWKWMKILLRNDQFISNFISFPSIDNNTSNFINK